jgi:hypothetical protein
MFRSVVSGSGCKAHKGPLGTLVHGEMDATIPSNAIMSLSFAARGTILPRVRVASWPVQPALVQAQQMQVASMESWRLKVMTTSTLLSRDARAMCAGIPTLCVLSSLATLLTRLLCGSESFSVLGRNAPWMLSPLVPGVCLVPGSTRLCLARDGGCLHNAWIPQDRISGDYFRDHRTQSRDRHVSASRPMMPRITKILNDAGNQTAFMCSGTTGSLPPCNTEAAHTSTGTNSPQGAYHQSPCNFSALTYHFGRGHSVQPPHGPSSKFKHIPCRQMSNTRVNPQPA